MGEYTIFALLGKKGIRYRQLGELADSILEFLMQSILPVQKTMTQKAIMETMKSLALDKGKDLIERVLIIRNLKAEGAGVAESAGKMYADLSNPQGNESYVVVLNSFEEMIDPINISNLSETEELKRTHHVRGSKRQKGYFRHIPFHYEFPTDSMRQARRILTETAFIKGREQFGTVKVVDEKGLEKTIPASAMPIKESMEGLKIAPSKPVTVPELEISPLQRLEKFIKILSEVST